MFAQTRRTVVVRLDPWRRAFSVFRYDTLEDPLFAKKLKACVSMEKALGDEDWLYISLRSEDIEHAEAEGLLERLQSSPPTVSTQVLDGIKRDLASGSVACLHSLHKHIDPRSFYWPARYRPCVLDTLQFVAPDNSLCLRLLAIFTSLDTHQILTASDLIKATNGDAELLDWILLLAGPSLRNHCGLSQTAFVGASMHSLHAKMRAESGSSSERFKTLKRLIEKYVDARERGVSELHAKNLLDVATVHARKLKRTNVDASVFRQWAELPHLPLEFLHLLHKPQSLTDQNLFALILGDDDLVQKTAPKKKQRARAIAEAARICLLKSALPARLEKLCQLLVESSTSDLPENIEIVRQKSHKTYQRLIAFVKERQSEPKFAALWRVLEQQANPHSKDDTTTLKRSEEHEVKIAEFFHATLPSLFSAGPVDMRLKVFDLPEPLDIRFVCRSLLKTTGVNHEARTNFESIISGTLKAKFSHTIAFALALQDHLREHENSQHRVADLNWIVSLISSSLERFEDFPVREATRLANELAIADALTNKTSDELLDLINGIMEIRDHQVGLTTFEAAIAE
ncbi:MAG: hypothetical protein MHM6MM_006424 [Cercozoa sp. M6MM]